MDNLKKLKIGVVAGGISSERDISLKSGGAVYESLIKNGFSAKLIDIKYKKQLKFINTYKIIVEPWVEGETDEEQMES